MSLDPPVGRAALRQVGPNVRTPTLALRVQLELTNRPDELVVVLVVFGDGPVDETFRRVADEPLGPHVADEPGVEAVRRLGRHGFDLGVLGHLRRDLGLAVARARGTGDHRENRDGFENLRHVCSCPVLLFVDDARHTSAGNSDKIPICKRSVLTHCRTYIIAPFKYFVKGGLEPKNSPFWGLVFSGFELNLFDVFIVPEFSHSPLFDKGY